jgi:hypothetical protein
MPITDWLQQPRGAVESQLSSRRVNVLAELRAKTKREFGTTLKAMREGSPPPSGSYKRSDFTGMTMDQLAEQLSKVIWERTGKRHDVQTAWINQVESGKVSVEPRLVEYIAEALGADAINTAILLEAHGYNGVASLAMRLQGCVVRIAPCFPESLEDERRDQRAQRQNGLSQARELVKLALESLLMERTSQQDDRDT